MTDKSKPEPTYDTVWQKMLQEEAVEKARKEAKRRAREYAPGWPVRADRAPSLTDGTFAPMRSYGQQHQPTLEELSSRALRAAERAMQDSSYRNRSAQAVSARTMKPQIAVAPQAQSGRPNYLSNPLYKALQMGVDLGNFASDAGGAMMGAELLFGEPGLAGATVEGIGSTATVLSGAGQAAMGDHHAFERAMRDGVLNHGALRLVPKTLRNDFADYLFGKALDNAIPPLTKDPRDSE